MGSAEAMERINRLVRAMRNGLNVGGLATLLGAGVLGLASTGCGAVFPEIATPLKAAPAGRELKPEPPGDLLYLEIKEAHIPERTRDGRLWRSEEGEPPDPFAMIVVNGKELFRTTVAGASFDPQWEDQPSGNYLIQKGSNIRVDLLDSQSMSNQAICSQPLRDLHEDAALGERELDLRCDGGARLTIIAGPARPKLGLGFFYEIALGTITVTRLHSHSPAARAGMKKGDHIIEIMGKKADNLQDGEAQSLINANAQIGVSLTLERDGTNKKIKVKQGAVYPMVKEFNTQQSVD